MKYLIAPTCKIASHWARSMGLAHSEFITITCRHDLRGLDYSDRSNFIYIEEEPFDYPPMNMKFIELMNEIEEILSNKSLT